MKQNLSDPSKEERANANAWARILEAAVATQGKRSSSARLVDILMCVSADVDWRLSFVTSELRRGGRIRAHYLVIRQGRKRQLDWGNGYYGCALMNTWGYTLTISLSGWPSPIPYL